MTMRTYAGQRLAMFVLTMFCASCASTHVVVPYEENMEGEYVYYALPRTVVQITSIVSVTEVDPNPPCDTKERLARLGLERPKLRGGKFFSFLEARLAKRVEADPGERYAIDLEGTGNSTLGITLDNRGILTKGGSESSDIVLPAVVGATELSATLVGKLAFGAATLGEPLLSKPSALESFCAAAEADLLRVRAMLLDLHGRLGAADSKEVLEFKAAKLTAAVSRLEAPFTGIKPGGPKTITCEVRPSNVGDFALFQWSQKRGIFVESIPANCDVPEGLTISEKDWVQVAEGNPSLKSKVELGHQLELSIARSASDLSQVSHSEFSKSGDRSFYFRVPAVAAVEVADVVNWNDPAERKATRKSDRVEWLVGQLGRTVSLPVRKSTNNTKVNVTLDGETGALLEVNAASTEADFEARLSELGTTIGGVVQAKDDAKLEKLKREQAILEARIAINAAKAALGEE